MKATLASADKLPSFAPVSVIGAVVAPAFHRGRRADGALTQSGAFIWGNGTM
jgi:hypothetical protein